MPKKKRVGWGDVERRKRTIAAREKRRITKELAELHRSEVERQITTEIEGEVSTQRLKEAKRHRRRALKNEEVCQKHFKPEDIVTEVSAFDPKKQVTITVQLKNHRLKADAVPSIFEDTPTKGCKKVKNTSLIENQEKDKIESSVKTNLIMEGDKKPERINIEDSDDDDDEDEEENDANDEENDDKDEDSDKDDEDSEIEVDDQSSPSPSVTFSSPYKTMPNAPVYVKENKGRIPQELKAVKRSPSTGSNSSTGSSEAQKLNPSAFVKRRKIEKPAPVVIGRQNDCYCWVCHRENIILCCIACPRAYHPRCANEPSLPNSDWVCPECQKILAAENVDSRSSTLAEISLDKLGALLKLSLNKMKQRAPIAFHQPVSLEHYPLYPHYVIHPMDFSLLEKNIKQKVYGCTEAFLADVKWISHNSCVFNGTQHPLSTNAKNLVKACDQDMQEIEVCPDCFVHSVVRNKYWFSEVCRKPHPLVWAKLKGFPYWPAKVVRILDGNVDARFFGAHDRAWVPVSQCYHLSKEMPTTSKPKKKGNYEVALDELNVHVHILIQKFGCFEYAPYRTAFNPENKYLVFHGIDLEKISKEEISFDVSSPIPDKFLSSEKENRFASFLESEQEKMNSDEIKTSDSVSEKQHSSSPLKLTDVLKSPFLFSERKSTDSQLSEKDGNENEANNEKYTLEDKTNVQNKTTIEVEKKDVCQVSPIKISDKVSASDQFRKLELALERIKGYVSSSVDTEKENEESQTDGDKNKNKDEENKEISDKAIENITDKTTPLPPLIKESITLPVIESDSVQETVEDVTKSLQTTKKTDSFFLKLNETIASCKAKLGIEVIDDLSDESGADENASRSDDDEGENTSSSEADEESSDEEVEDDDEQSDVMEISDDDVEVENEENDLENKSEETDEENSKSDEESDSDCTDTEIESHGTDASPRKEDKSSEISNKEPKSDEQEDNCSDKPSDLSLKGDSVSYNLDGEMASASGEAKAINTDLQTQEVTVDDSGALEVVGENSSSESSIGVSLRSLNEQFNQTRSSEITASPTKNIASHSDQQIIGLISESFSKDRIADVTAEDSVSKNVSPVTKLHQTSENNNQINVIDNNNMFHKDNKESESETTEKDVAPSDTPMKSVCDGEIPENSNKNESVDDDDDIFIMTPTRPKSPPVIILDDDAENEDSSVSDTYAVKTPPYSTSVESISNEDNPPCRRDSGDDQNRFSPSKALNIKRRASSEVSEEINGISNSADLNDRRKRRKLSSEESSEDDIQIVSPVKRVGLTGAKRTFNKPNPVVEAAKRVSPTLESVKRNLVKEALVTAANTTPPSNTSRIDTEFMRPEATSPMQSPQSILRTPMIDTRNLTEHEKEVLFLKRKLSCLMTAYKIQGWKCNQEREELRHNMNLIVMEMRACLEADKKQAIDILVHKFEQEKQKSIEETKRKQWCASCLLESRYACCWNTSYCSVECQKKDFTEHRKTCTQVKKRNKQNLFKKIFPASTVSKSEDNKGKVIILNMKSDTVRPTDQAVTVTSQQNPVSKPEIQFISPSNTQTSSASSSKPVQVVFTHAKPSTETNVDNATTSKPSTSNALENNLDSNQVISHVRNKACDLGTAISLLKKKNLESTVSDLSKKKELREKDTIKEEANLEDVYFPSPPKITFEGYDTASPDSNITINENEESVSNCDTDTEIPPLREGVIPERDIDLSDTDDMDNSMVNIGHSVEVKAKFLNKCLVYGQTASKLTRCLVDIIFPDLRLLASCSAFGMKSNVTKLTRAALPARKVYAIIDYVTKRFPYALRSEIVLAINMKCKEARFMLRKQEEDSRNKMTSRRLLAKEQEDERASSATPTAVETVSSATAATTIHISVPSTSSHTTPKTHPNVVCVKSSTAPSNMPKKSSNVPSILRCGPQFLMPKPMFGPVSNNTTILQTPPLVRKRETVKELLMRNNLSKGNMGIERKDGPNIVMAVDAHKHSTPGPVSMCAPSSSNPRPYLIIGTPLNASRQPSPLQNPPAQPDSSKM